MNKLWRTVMTIALILVAAGIVLLVISRRRKVEEA